MPGFVYNQDDYYSIRQNSTDLVFPTEWWREDGQWHMAIHGPKWMLADIERELSANKGVLTDMQDNRLLVTFCTPNVIAAREATS